MNIEFAFSVSNKPNSPIISADHVISTHKGPRGYSRYFLSDGCLQRPQGVKLVFGLIGDEDNKDGIPRKGIYVQQTKVKHIREDSWILSRIWKHNWKKSFRLESGFFLSWLSGTMAIREYMLQENSWTMWLRPGYIRLVPFWQFHGGRQSSLWTQRVKLLFATQRPYPLIEANVLDTIASLV